MGHAPEGGASVTAPGDRLARQIAIKAGAYGGRLDEDIGSLLEAWYTRPVLTGTCPFCGRDVKAGFPRGGREFCSPDCRRAVDVAFDARMEIGRRDMKRRGFD